MITASLKKFFNDAETNVLVIKGRWGVGKTFAFNQFIDENSKSLSNYKFLSKASLFGASEIEEVKNEIINNCTEISDTQEANSLSKKGLLASLTNSKFVEALGKVSNKIQIAGDVINTALYSNISESIVCLDDIERKSESLKIEQIFGLVDDLVEVKSCKVILILNDDEISESQELVKFKRYKEKIIDLEITYQPSIVDLFNIHFGSTPHKSISNYGLEMVRVLKIDNIRILKKIKWVIESFWESVSGHKSELLEKTMIKSAIFISWAYYINPEELDRILIALSQTKPSDLDRDKLEMNHAVLGKYKMYGSIFDEYILDFLKCGLISKPDDLKEDINELYKNFSSVKVHELITEIWLKVSSSFDDNLPSVRANVYELFNNCAESIPIDSFDDLLQLVEANRRDEFTTRYLQANEFKGSKNLAEQLITKLKSKKLVIYLNDYIKKFYNFTIDQALDAIVSDDYQNEHIQILYDKSVDQIIDWIMTSPEGLKLKINSIGLILYSTNNAEDPMVMGVVNTFKESLEILSRKSDYNKFRVDSFFEPINSI